MSTQRTPTPWTISRTSIPGESLVNVGPVMGLSSRSIQLSTPDAAFIVQACNNFDTLLEAAKAGCAGLVEVIAYLRRDGGYTGLAQDRLDQLRAAIVAVEGGQ